MKNYNVPKEEPFTEFEREFFENLNNPNFENCKNYKNCLDDCPNIFCHTFLRHYTEMCNSKE